MSTTPIKPKNKEQEDAITNGQAFLKKGNPKEWFIIVGKAGTGKTTIVQEVIRPYVKTSTILICALSHKAKLVLSEKLHKTFGSRQIISKSIAGALGMNMDLETGNFVLPNGAKKIPPIKQADIIIVDECSMVNEESHRLIMSEKLRHARVIYLGDIRQLPPIRDKGDVNMDKPSPSFYSKNLAVLTERIRQGEESPILPFADLFGDNSRLSHPAKQPASPTFRKSITNDYGSLIFEKDIYQVIKDNLPSYQQAIATGEGNLIKTVTYRNETRKSINDMVRFGIFGDKARHAQYLPKDIIIFSDNHDVDTLDEPISNSFEVQINHARPSKYCGYQCWELDFVYEGLPVTVYVLAEAEVKRHQIDVTKAFTRAKAQKWGSFERDEAIAYAWRLKKLFAPIEYAYAISSHKSQGSTYHTVIVDETDIMSVTLTSNKAKSQSMYTAITRASHVCIVVDGN